MDLLPTQPFDKANGVPSRTTAGTEDAPSEVAYCLTARPLDDLDRLSLVKPTVVFTRQKSLPSPLSPPSPQNRVGR